MAATITYRGSFWLPGSDHRVGGEINWEPGSTPSLRVFGSLRLFSADVYEFDGRLDQHPVVHGELADGTGVTLLEVFGPPDLPGVIDAGWTALGGVIIGDALGTDVDPPRFSSVQIEFGCLLDWAGLTGLRPSGHPSDVGITVRVPEPMTATLADATVALKVECSDTGRIPGTWTFSEHAFIEVTTRTPASVRDLDRRFLTPLRNLLTFAAVKRARVITIRLGSVADEGISPFHLRFLNAASYELLDPELDRENRHHMLFSLTHPDDFNGLINGWFDAWEAYQPAITNALAAELVDGLWVSTRFSLLAAAVEGYHEARLRASSEPTEKVARREAVLQGCPKEHQDWLNNVLPRGPSFAERVRDVATFAIQAADRAAVMIGDVERFGKDVANMRNRFAHGRGSLTRKESIELHGLSEALAWTLRVCWLRDIGLPAADVAQLIEQSDRYALAVAQR